MKTFNTLLLAPLVFFLLGYQQCKAVRLIQATNNLCIPVTCSNTTFYSYEGRQHPSTRRYKLEKNKTIKFAGNGSNDNGWFLPELADYPAEEQLKKFETACIAFYVKTFAIDNVHHKTCNVHHYAWLLNVNGNLTLHKRIETDDPENYPPETVITDLEPAEEYSVSFDAVEKDFEINVIPISAAESH